MEGYIHSGHVDNSENFTSESLTNFLHSSRKKADVDSIHRELKRRKNMQNPRNQQPGAESNPVMMMDSNVRNNLAELVKILMNAGHIEQLETLLKDHQTFIQDILQMIEKSKKG